VRIHCAQCKRAGNLSLARLAERHGAEAELWKVLDVVTRDCPWREGKGYGKKHVQCLAKFTDITDPNPPPPDVPRGFFVFPGGKPQEPCEPKDKDQSFQDVRTRRSNSSS
jgi:hypothetical protein